ncbi:MAG: hypothetical protein PHH84_00505 [Oscillospiraceae bacterium]|nr:hypothetical protein [Oscillospiraceae bacterium]MDD4413050.1 hypothetical protein [Oscillospiraceae bacterium]
MPFITWGSGDFTVERIAQPLEGCFGRSRIGMPQFNSSQPFCLV